jgi:hypothetical protein
MWKGIVCSLGKLIQKLNECKNQKEIDDTDKERIVGTGKWQNLRNHF